MICETNLTFETISMFYFVLVSSKLNNLKADTGVSPFALYLSLILIEKGF